MRHRRPRSHSRRHTGASFHYLPAPSLFPASPPGLSHDGWRAFRIQGVLDFSLVGILSKISALLAENKIGIFAVSTYNTDYVFTKAERFDKAISVLSCAGYEIID